MKDVKVNDEADAILAHYGILGMRWGVRRAVGSDGLIKRGGSKNKGSEDHQTAKALKAKGVKNLSDAELKKLTNRMNLERNFRDLKSSDMQKGLDFVKTATAMATTVTTAYAIATSPLGKQVASTVKNVLTKK